MSVMSDRESLTKIVRDALLATMHDGAADRLGLQPGTRMGPALDTLSAAVVDAIADIDD